MADSASSDTYWDNANLPEASVAPEESPSSSDDTTYLNPPANACAACGREIVREPGQRGRLPKFHPECKPTKTQRASSSPRVRVTKEDERKAIEVEEALAKLESGLGQLIMMLSVFEPYDAFVLYVNGPSIIENARVVLMQWDWGRKAATNAKVGGSVIGLLMTLLLTGLPIAAHHKWLPKGKVSSLMISAPLIMERMNERMVKAEDGEGLKAELLVRLREQQQREQAKAYQMRQENEGGIPATDI